MKRFFIISALLLTLLLTSITLFLCLFNINDHSQWLSRQIEKATGYQISFISIGHSGWQDLSFSVSGISVGSGESLLEIEKVTIEVARWDLWKRQLELGLVDLAGIHLHLKVPPLKAGRDDQKNGNAAPYQLQKLPWDKLQINKLRLSDLNLDLSNAGQSLRLEQANLSTANLRVIDNKKLLPLFTGKVRLDAPVLAVKLADSTRFRVDNLSLYGDLDLPKLQAKLALGMQRLAVSQPNQAEIIADNSSLELQLDQNRLSVTRLSLNIFSGELTLQAEARLAFHLFPPAFSVGQLQLSSLRLKDMRLTIPAFMQEPADIGLPGRDQKQKVAIDSLFLKQVKLQNIDIRSEEKQLPLTVKGGYAAISDFYLLRNHQLLGELEQQGESGTFMLQADYLQWAETVIEQFELFVSLPEDKPLLLQLKPLQ